MRRRALKKQNEKVSAAIVRLVGSAWRRRALSWETSLARFYRNVHCRVPCFGQGGPISSPFMRLLDRYLLRELLVPLAYCLSGFLLFWVSFDLLAELSGFQEDNLGAAEIVRIYVFKAPELL